MARARCVLIAMAAATAASCGWPAPWLPQCEGAGAPVRGTCRVETYSITLQRPVSTIADRYTRASVPPFGPVDGAARAASAAEIDDLLAYNAELGRGPATLQSVERLTPMTVFESDPCFDTTDITSHVGPESDGCLDDDRVPDVYAAPVYQGGACRTEERAENASSGWTRTTTCFAAKGSGWEWTYAYQFSKQHPVTSLNPHQAFLPVRLRKGYACTDASGAAFPPNLTDRYVKAMDVRVVCTWAP